MSLKATHKLLHHYIHSMTISIKTISFISLHGPRVCCNHTTWIPSRYYLTFCKSSKAFKLASSILKCNVDLSEQA